MKAPAIDERGFVQDEYGCHLYKEDPHAYNAASALATSVDATTHDEDPYHYIWKEYTKVGLKEFSVDVEKVWDDDDDRDGLRPETVTLRLLADGKDIGRTVTLPIMPPSSPWVIPMPQWYYTFEHLDYTNPDGSVIHYTLVEDEVPPGYTASVVIDGNKFTMVNKHITEKVSKEGSKIWSGDTEYTRPEYVTVRLYADGVMVQQKKIYPDLSGRWYYSFTNLPKYEDGHEIVYTVEEVRTGAIDSYHPEYDGDDIINTYHPYGDLEVKKIVENVTPQSRDTEFTFGFEFSKDDDPLYESFAYAILDENGDVIPGREGTVATGQTVTIKGGESIHVYDIPEYVDYKVYENEEDGFTLVAHSGDTGTIKPNATKYAEFKNRYDTQGFVDFEGVKTLYGRELLRYKFHFGVYRLGVNEEGEETATLIRTASNEFPDNNVTDEDGNIISSTAPVHLGYIYYGIDDNEKTYRYKIVEFIGRGEADWDRAVNADGVTYVDATDEQRAAGGFTLDGYTFDNTCYYATVTVTDNGDGTMKTEVVYTDENGNVLNEEDLDRKSVV